MDLKKFDIIEWTR